MSMLVTDAPAYVEEDLELQISFNHLFSKSRDFRRACRCGECLDKIIRLQEFETEIKRKKHLVGRYDLELDNIQLHCSSLRNAVGWTQGMLDLLYKHLEEVYQKSGAEFSRRKRSHSEDLIRDMYYELVEMHGRCNLIDEHFENITTLRIPGLEPIGDEIRCGFMKYEVTPVKDKAFAILQQMAQLDHEMEMEKKAVGEGQGLEPSISKQYLEEQIKLVMEFPATELCQEVKNITPVAQSVPHKRLLVNEAFTFIYGTSRDIVKERDYFWQQFLKRPSWKESNEHMSNGLNHTLDSLLQKVHDFKYHWEKEYASIIEA